MGVILDKSQLTAGVRASLNYRVTVAQKLQWRRHCYNATVSQIKLYWPQISPYFPFRRSRLSGAWPWQKYGNMCLKDCFEPQIYLIAALAVFNILS